MPAERICSDCGGKLSPDEQGGLCVRCLFNLGLKTEAGTEAPAPINEKPGDRIGRYKLLQKIGEGGCGVVYMAEQEEPVRRRVALKVIKLGMDTREVIVRFEAERQALALMDHPNIAKIFDAGATSAGCAGSQISNLRSQIPAGRPYFVMELVRGVRITEYCDQHNLSTHERLELLIKVCQAIQHAHQKGIIHRDIKPSNILVTVNDGVPVPKVIDFGIAKATEGRLTDKTLFTAFQQFMGTPAYMSPEQAEMTSLDIDTRSDIYSLGVLLYELLTGKTPFDAKVLLAAGLDAMRRTIREQEPAKPSTRLSTMAGDDLTTVAKQRQAEPPKLVNLVRGDLDWIVMKCLEKDRARRYETANGVATDLQRHLNNEPVLACPPSKFYRFNRLVRRNRFTFVASGAVAVSMLIGLAISTHLFLREKAALNRAVSAELLAQGRLAEVQVAKAETENALKESEQARQQAELARNGEAKLRARAEAEEKLAVTAARKSEQVATFLKEMLDGVGPSVARGRDTQMLREIMDKTSQRVGSDLKDEPEVEALLRGTLGKVYYDLGVFTNAEAMDRELLAIQRKLHGNENAEVASALGDLSIRLEALGKLGEAETMCREALAMQRKLKGNEHPAVAISLVNLGAVLKTRGSLGEAEAVFREALAMQQKLPDTDAANLATTLNNLGSLLQDQRKPAEAEPLLREALSIRKRLRGEVHSEVGTTLNNLALTLDALGKLDEAEKLHRESLALRMKLLGNDHPKVAVALNNLALVLRRQGKLAEAEPLVREALDIQRKRLGDEHPDVAWSLSGLGQLLLAQGKLPEAEARLREALDMRRMLLSPEHPGIAITLSALAAALEQQGKLAEAEPLLREELESTRKRYGESSWEVCDRIARLATVLLNQDKFAEAESFARECLAIGEKLKPDSPRTLYARSLLGAILTGEKRYAEAEPLLLSAYDDMKARGKEIPTDHLRRTLESLQALYMAKGDSTRAAEWKQRLEEFQKIQATAKPSQTRP